MTYAVTHEPSRFVCSETERQMELKGADSFPTEAHYIDGLNPLLEIDMRALKDGSHRYGELSTAIPAFPQTFPTWTL